MTPNDAIGRKPARRPGRRGALAAGLVVIVLALTAVVVGWVMADPERLRQGIERSVSSMSGKPFSIDGSFDYEFGRIVTVTAERLRWMDDDPRESPLLDIGQASVSIDLLGLLSRTLRITDLQVRDAALNFDWSDDRFNWRMGSGDADASGRTVPLLIDRGSLHGVDLTFRHPHLEDDVRLQVVSAQHQADEADRLVITSDLRFEDRDLQLNGKVQLGTGHGRPTIAFDGNARGPGLAGIINQLSPAALRERLPRTEFAAATRLSYADSTLTIDTVQLTSPGIRAEFNGQLHTAGPGPSLAGQLSVSGERLANWLGDVDIAALDAPFEVKGALDGSAQSLRLDGLTASLGSTQLAGNFELSGEGLKDARFDLRGQIDDLSGLIPPNTDYRPAARNLDIQIKGRHRPGTLDLEQFQASIGEVKASLSGRLQHEAVWSAHQLRLDASGPRLSDLGTFGDYTPPDQPFTLKAAIDGDAKTQHFGDLQFRSGDNDLSGKLTLVPAKRPRLQLDLESDRFRLDDFFQPGPSGAATADAAQPSDQPPEDPIFGDEPLPFDLLDRFDAALRVRLDNLLSYQRQWRNVILDAEVDNGTVQLRQASLDAAAGKLKLSGTLTPHPSGRALALSIEADDAMLASEAMTPEEIERLPRHAIDGHLSAVGNTPHELVSSLDGFVWIVGGKGYGSRTKLAPLYGDFLTEVLTSINPAQAEQPEVRIDCDGAYLDVEQGKVRTAPAVVLKTERIVVVAAGRVDLATGAIDVAIETTPLRGVGIGLGDVINPLTKLSGTLRKPAIILDPKGAVIEGGAAVATAGLSVVVKNLAKRLLGSRNVCQRLGQQALEIRRKKDPDNLPRLAAQFIKDDAKTDGRPASAGQDDSDTRSPYDFLD